ncbi:MAG: pilus assembly protein PilM [bacterium]
MNLFSSAPVSYLGVDIGSSSIKMVELKKHQDKVVLINYGYSDMLANTYPDANKLDIKAVSATIEKVFKKTDMVARDVVASLPTFTVFSSIINLSGKLTQKDLDSSITWEAKKIIPLPLNDIVLDWQRIDDIKEDKDPDLAKAEEPKQEEEKQEPKQELKQENHKILLIGAPKSLIKSYAYTFKSIKFNLVNLETEVFGLIRSLLGNDKSTVMVAQIGANSTNIFIIDKGVPVLSRSIDVGGLSITKAISKGLNISLEKAEQYKYDLVSQDGELPKIITDVISPVFNEAKYILESFSSKEDLNVSKIILTGGSSMLSGLSDYFANILNKNVIIGDPWFRVAYPMELKPVLEQIGPRMAVAIGLAMREFDKD